MNRDPEDWLKEAPLHPVPERLDRRIETLIGGRPSAGPRWVSFRVPLWAAAAACLVSGLLGVFLSRGSARGAAAAPVPSPVTLIDPGSKPLPVSFTIGRRPVKPAFFARERGSVQAIDLRWERLDK